jgi:hypothetical protein
MALRTQRQSRVTKKNGFQFFAKTILMTDLEEARSSTDWTLAVFILSLTQKVEHTVLVCERKHSIHTMLHLHLM